MNILKNFGHFGSKNEKKDYCVIGLGSFGTEVARILQKEQQKLTVIDENEEIIDSIGKEFDNAALINAANMQELGSIGISLYDVVIVAITNMEKSITVCSNLREMGVRNILAKATNKIHQQILKSMGISQTVIPNIEAAQKFAYQSIYGINVNLFQFGNDKSNSEKDNAFMIEVNVFNRDLWNKKVHEINLSGENNATIISIKKADGLIILPVSGQDIVNRGDSLFLLTKKENLAKIKTYFQAKTNN